MSLKGTKTEKNLLAAFAGALVSIGGSLFLALQMNLGIVGVAIAFSIGNIINASLLYILMHQKVKSDLLSWVTTLKMVILSLIMGSVVFMVKSWIPFAGSSFRQIGLLFLYTFAGIGVYFGLSFLFGLREFTIIWRQVKRIK